MPWPTVESFKAHARITDAMDDVAIGVALAAVKDAIRLRCPVVQGGYTPPAVEQAALLWTSRLLARRNSPEGIVGTPEFGVANIGRWDPDVGRLLSPYTEQVIA